MPRGKQGGPRQGNVGTAYPQRTDLQAATPVPIQAPRGQPYGDRAQQIAAQHKVPMAPPPGPGTLSATPPAPSSAPALPGAGAGAGAGPPEPGSLPWTHPTQRPNEPITAGLPQGAGPGPEALTGVGALAHAAQNEQGTLRDLLGAMAAGPASSTAVRDLASVAGA